MRRPRHRISLIRAVGALAGSVTALLVVSLGGVWWYMHETLQAERDNIEVHLPALERSQLLAGAVTRLQTISLEMRLIVDASEATSLQRQADDTISRALALASVPAPGANMTTTQSALHRARLKFARLAMLRIRYINENASLLPVRSDLLKLIAADRALIDETIPGQDLYPRDVVRLTLIREIATTELLLSTELRALISLAGHSRREATDALTSVPANILARLDGYRFLILPMFLAALLLLLFTCYVVLYQFTYRPLRSITAQLTSERKRAVDEASSNYRIQEIQALADGLDELHSLHAARREQDHVLKAKNRQLEAVNDALEQFAYVASHDLQEPLRKLQQFSGILAEDYRHQLDEDGRYYLSTIDGAARRMSMLIRDTLTYARTSASSVETSPLDLNEVVLGIQRDVELTIEESQATIRLDPLPVVHANRTGMEQLVRNLLINAIKYARTGVPAEVRIHSRSTAGSDAVEWLFSDNGAGIADRYQSRIFKPFEYLQTSSTESGSGLGLAICMRVCVLHGWQLDVTSTVGVGSTFRIRIPRSSVVNVSDRPRTDIEHPAIDIGV